MKRKLCLTVLVAFMIVLFQSCENDTKYLLEIQSEITRYCETNNVEVSTVTGLAFSSATHNGYTVTITESPLVEKKGHSINLVASMAAKILYDALPTEEQKEDKTVRVTVNSIGRGGYMDYKFSDLAVIAELMQKTLVASEKLRRKKFDEAYTYFDEKAIPHDVYQTKIIEGIIWPNRDIFLKIKKYSPVGFEFTKYEGKDYVALYAGGPIDEKLLILKYTFPKNTAAKVVGFFVQ